MSELIKNIELLGNFELIRNILHYSFHFLVPLLLAYLFWGKHWKLAAFLMIATIAIDLDHLLATPIFLIPIVVVLAFTHYILFGPLLFMDYYYLFLHGK